MAFSYSIYTGSTLAKPDDTKTKQDGMLPSVDSVALDAV